MQHVAYMSIFFIFYYTDRTKIYRPHLMNVGEQQFFSPPNFYQRNLRSPIGTHNFKLSFFYWHSLTFLEMTNCDQTDLFLSQNALELIDTNLVLLDTTLPQTELMF